MAITQCKVIQLVPIESPYTTSYKWLLIINLPHILHSFQVIADYMSNFRKRQEVGSL